MSPVPFSKKGAGEEAGCTWIKFMGHDISWIAPSREIFCACALQSIMHFLVCFPSFEDMGINEIEWASVSSRALVSCGSPFAEKLTRCWSKGLLFRCRIHQEGVRNSLSAAVSHVRFHRHLLVCVSNWFLNFSLKHFVRPRAFGHKLITSISWKFIASSKVTGPLWNCSKIANNLRGGTKLWTEMLFPVTSPRNVESAMKKKKRMHQSGTTHNL